MSAARFELKIIIYQDDEGNLTCASGIVEIASSDVREYVSTSPDRERLDEWSSYKDTVGAMPHAATALFERLMRLQANSPALNRLMFPGRPEKE